MYIYIPKTWKCPKIGSAGTKLILTKILRKAVLQGYYQSTHNSPLISNNGAQHIVTWLQGHSQANNINGQFYADKRFIGMVFPSTYEFDPNACPDPSSWVPGGAGNTMRDSKLFFTSEPSDPKPKGTRESQPCQNQADHIPPKSVRRQAM